VFELTGYTPSFGYTPRTPFTANPSSIIHNIHGRGNYVYIAHYASGVYVADVHDPLAISNAGGYDTYTGTSTGYIGCWGVYPYFPSGRWIASDTQTGLYLFAFAGLQPRTRSPLLSPADGDTLAFSPVEEFRWRAAARQADDPHEYRVRISGPGLDTLVRTPDTSFVLPALPSLQEGGTYSWHLTIADEFTAVSGQDTFRFVYGGNPLGVDDDGGTPAAFGLGQNFPNPFNPSTTMHFVIPAGTVGRASLHVYDVLGRQVATLLDGPVESGAHAARFDGSGLASGVYLVRLAAGGAVAVRKMLLAR